MIKVKTSTLKGKFDITCRNENPSSEVRCIPSLNYAIHMSIAHPIPCHQSPRVPSLNVPFKHPGIQTRIFEASIAMTGGRGVFFVNYNCYNVFEFQGSLRSVASGSPPLKLGTSCDSFLDDSRGTIYKVCDSVLQPPDRFHRA